MAMSTPWGPVQAQKNIARGIIQVSTASHGGIHLSPTLNAQVHEAWREPDGWYEEDCDYAKAVLTFPQHFDEQDVRYAHRSAKMWYPAQYARVTGVPVTELLSVGTCPGCGVRVERSGGRESTRCAEEGCDTLVQLRDEERIHQPDGKMPAVTRHAREASGSPYRATEADVATIAALTAAGHAAGWVAKVLWMPKPDAAYDSVQVYVGPQQPLPTEHSTVSWNNWTRQVTVHPGWLLCVDQVAEYIAAYIERRSRGHMGYDGLEAVYHKVTGRTGRNPYTAADVASSAPAPMVEQSRSVSKLAGRFAAETVYAEPPKYVEPTDANLAAAFASLRVRSLEALYDDIRAAFTSEYADQIAHVRAAAEPPNADDWPARIERLLPFCQPGEQYNRAVAEAVGYAQRVLRSGYTPEVNVVEGEVAAGWRPREHLALARSGQPVPPISDEAEPQPTASAEHVERVARRVTIHEARRHFEAGGTVLVSEYGHEPTCTVGPLSTTHDRTRTTWDELVAQVRMWRGRYPNQRFYVVSDPVQDDEPAPPRVPGRWAALVSA